jgi:hypothetical protein
MVNHTYVIKVGGLLLATLAASVFVRTMWLQNMASGFRDPGSPKRNPLDVHLTDPIMKKLQLYQKRKQAAEKPPPLPHYDNKFHVFPTV